MRTFRLAMAQINPTVGDLKGNTSKILGYIEEARRQRADLVAFPEMAIPGYPPEDLLFKAQCIADNRACLDQGIQSSKGIAVVLGFVHLDEELYNSAAVIQDGELLGIYHKMHLPNYSVFDEKRYFAGGDKGMVLNMNGVAVGVTICEDLWHPEGPGKQAVVY